MSPEGEPKPTKSSIICQILQENAGKGAVRIQSVADLAGAAVSTVYGVIYMNQGSCQMIDDRMYVQVDPDSSLITTQTGNSPLIKLPDDTVPRDGVAAADHRGMMVRYTPLNEG
jgi:hypothetical protein